MNEVKALEEALLKIKDELLTLLGKFGHEISGDAVTIEKQAQADGTVVAGQAQQAATEAEKTVQQDLSSTGTPPPAGA